MAAAASKRKGEVENNHITVNDFACIKLVIKLLKH